MNVYVAAPFPAIGYAQEVAKKLTDAGHRVTSRWLEDQNHGMTDFHARMDLNDVSEADVLLALNPREWSNSGTGGRHVELGYAFALGKQLILVGVRTNVFHYLNDVLVVEEDKFDQWLREWK